tara:strand:+ start:152 stop:295 length:144 start_codon:yes stop_codon:yes gene_type:complete
LADAVRINVELEAVLEGNDERKTTDYFKIATTRINLMKKPLILSNHI